eukprot:gb/GECG01014671.1/.p1 GENE.gb/GECG01014671.1/~~gb/GECG01014671.1/.p1  ORF type:complete len:634 (+),score=73.30 gb/GECG01014671.1/:1-1902(+)
MARLPVRRKYGKDGGDMPQPLSRKTGIQIAPRSPESSVSEGLQRQTMDISVRKSSISTATSSGGDCRSGRGENRKHLACQQDSSSPVSRRKPLLNKDAATSSHRSTPSKLSQKRTGSATTSTKPKDASASKRTQKLTRKSGVNRRKVPNRRVLQERDPNASPRTLVKSLSSSDHSRKVRQEPKAELPAKVCTSAPQMTGSQSAWESTEVSTNDPPTYPEQISYHGARFGPNEVVSEQRKECSVAQNPEGKQIYPTSEASSSLVDQIPSRVEAVEDSVGQKGSRDSSDMRHSSQYCSYFDYVTPIERLKPSSDNSNQITSHSCATAPFNDAIKQVEEMVESALSRSRKPNGEDSEGRCAASTRLRNASQGNMSDTLTCAEQCAVQTLYHIQSAKHTSKASSNGMEIKREELNSDECRDQLTDVSGSSGRHRQAPRPLPGEEKDVRCSHSGNVKERSQYRFPEDASSVRASNPILSLHPTQDHMYLCDTAKKLEDELLALREVDQAPHYRSAPRCRHRTPSSSSVPAEVFSQQRKSCDIVKDVVKGYANIGGKKQLSDKKRVKFNDAISERKDKPSAGEQHAPSAERTIRDKEGSEHSNSAADRRLDELSRRLYKLRLEARSRNTKGSSTELQNT